MSRLGAFLSEGWFVVKTNDKKISGAPQKNRTPENFTEREMSFFIQENFWRGRKRIELQRTLPRRTEFGWRLDFWRERRCDG